MGVIASCPGCLGTTRGFWRLHHDLREGPEMGGDKADGVIEEVLEAKDRNKPTTATHKELFNVQIYQFTTCCPSWNTI